MGLRAVSLALVGWLSVGCGPGLPQASTPERTEAVSPLGPSYVLIPLPSDDVSLLGRVLAEVPQPGRSLDELSQPNPCVEHLSEPLTTASLNTFEDAEELRVGASASATLGMFGFRADAERATHFVYRLQTERQVQQRDSSEYATCCATHNCGYGYIAALVAGSGEYASAEEVSANARADLAFAGGEGSVGLRVLHRRAVRGYLAAVVRVTAKSTKLAKLGPLGVTERDVNLSTTSDEFRKMYNKEKLWVCADTVTREWAFCDIRGKVTENEFVRSYARETASGELDAVDGRRNTGALLGSGALALSLTAATIGGVFVTMSVAEDEQDKTCYDREGQKSSCTGSLGVAFATVIVGLGAIASGVWFGLELSNGDGPPHEHVLSESEGRRYADRYNRALLRRVMRDAERSRAGGGLTLLPGMLRYKF